jgi:hypothetical protein
MNTHNYDGKLNIDLLPELITIKSLDINIKKERCQDIRNIAINIFDNISIKYMDIIINSIGTSSNIDTSNGLIAGDLLTLCWLYRHNTNFMNELNIQLKDMHSGSCPQGRTHRLFQLLLAFI